MATSKQWILGYVSKIENTSELTDAWLRINSKMVIDRDHLTVIRAELEESKPEFGKPDERPLSPNAINNIRNIINDPEQYALGRKVHDDLLFKEQQQTATPSTNPSHLA